MKTATRVQQPVTINPTRVKDAVDEAFRAIREEATAAAEALGYEPGRGLLRQVREAAAACPNERTAECLIEHFLIMTLPGSYAYGMHAPFDRGDIGPLFDDLRQMIAAKREIAA
jgi:hypothetical protein